MDSDKTMKIVTNLDRGGVEGLLGEIRAQAAAKNLPELASLFNGIEGMPRAQIEQRVGNVLDDDDADHLFRVFAMDGNA